MSRRTFLLASGGTAVGAGVALAGGQLLADAVDVEGSRAAVGPLVPAVKAPPLPAGADFADDRHPDVPHRERRLLPDRHRIRRSRGSRAEDWRLRIHGMVDRELTLTYEDLRDRPAGRTRRHA